MNADQIAELLEENIRKAYGDKLIADAGILSGVPEMLPEIARNLQLRLSDLEIEVTATQTNLLLQKSIPNLVDETSTLFSIEISTAGTARLWRRNTFQNLFGNEIQYFGMLGTSAKDVSRMLQQFRPPVPNTEFELKDGMQGILALTVELEKPVGPDHFEQLKSIKDWCTSNNFCITALMQHNFWSEVIHDSEQFVDSVIATVDRENATCTGVVISSADILEEILPEACTRLISQLRERGKNLYAPDAGEIQMAPHREFAMIQEAMQQEAEAHKPEPEPDLNSVLEQMRVGIDQLDYIQAGNHNYSITLDGKQLQVIEIEKQNGFYTLSMHFYRPRRKAMVKMPGRMRMGVCHVQFQEVLRRIRGKME